MNANEVVYEADFSRLTSMLLPYYYRYSNGWYISPEQWLGENHHPDYTISRVSMDVAYYGAAIPHIVYEVKRSASQNGASWLRIVDQMWDQCDAANNMPLKDEGTMWAIGQRGLEICFFRFDLLAFENSIYTNFEPLNLNNWTIGDFNDRGIELEVETLVGINVIRVIKWRLDNGHHHRHIHAMFMHMLNNNP